MTRIRNFCIIAHIDHGKSTLADRIIEYTNTVDTKKLNTQVLDDMDIEQERGITIKSHPIQMEYIHKDGVKYIFNLIDTPGHVDFTYEVSRSMAACEGALLLIDSTQGVEAQTVSNMYLALEANLEIIPVVNKIDMKNSNVDDTLIQIEDLMGQSQSNIVALSAKTGYGLNDLFEKIINDIPPPLINENEDKFSALIFDSYFDQYRGVIIYIRVFSGTVRRGMTAEFFKYARSHEILEVGILKMDRIPKEKLKSGDVGYIIVNVKEVSNIKVGDTITTKDSRVEEPLKGYKPIKPMVFSGLYPIDSKDYENLRISLDKLKLNDSSLTFEPNTSAALGFGFRCGFLGPLHMEIVQERLEREFGLDLISTCPNVNYHVLMKDKSTIKIDNPSDMPSESIESIYEPYIKIEIINPKEYIGPVINLCTSHRGTYKSTNFLSPDKVQLIFEIPLSEIIFEFFEKLKSVTKGYASLDYEFIEDRISKLIKLDIRVSNDIVDALSIIVHKDDAYRYGSKLCKRLKNEIHRQQFEIPIQALVGSKVIARETIKALRKNVTAKCYGGDISRKRKLLQKQAEGKKRMKRLGSVEVPQEAFMAVLKNEAK